MEILASLIVAFLAVSALTVQSIKRLRRALQSTQANVSHLYVLVGLLESEQKKREHPPSGPERDNAYCITCGAHHTIQRLKDLCNGCECGGELRLISRWNDRLPHSQRAPEGRLRDLL